MKKLLLVFVIAFSVILLSACATQRDAAPEILGANLTPIVEIGDSYDPKAGVTVEDREDDDDTLTAALEVRGYDPLDLLVEGTSTFTLYVIDSAGNEASVTILLTVVRGNPTLSGVNLTPETFAGDPFDPLAGISASDPQDGDITSSLTTSGFLTSMLATPGEYTYSVVATDSDGKTATASILLTVIEKPGQLPIISGANLNPTVIQGNNFNPLSGVTASDLQDGNITSDLELIGYDPLDLLFVGTYTYTISVTDSDENTVSVTVNLTVLERPEQLPTISGVNTTPTITQGDSYNPLTGVTADDPQDGDVTDELLVIGYDVASLNIPGEYTFTISITDSDDNTVTATIVLTVEVRPAPTISGVNRTPSILEGESYNPLTGVTAFDPLEGNLTSSLTTTYLASYANTPGVHVFTVSVENSYGITTSVSVTLTVTALVITAPEFSGVQPTQTYYIGSGPYDPKAGVTAFDLVDGNITHLIQVTGIYLLESPGTYQITLRVTNSAGIRTSVTISLTVAVSEVPITLTTDPVTVTLAHAMGESNQLLIQKYADAFRAHYLALGHDLTVVVPAGVGGYDTLKNNMINAITAGDVPNLVQGYPDHVSEYLNGKAVVKLDPYIVSPQWGLHGEDSFDDIIESYRDENSQYDAVGSFYSLPFNKSTEVMIYNKTAFDFLEIPEPQTWQDVFAAAPALKAYGDAIAEAKVRALNPLMGELELAPLIAAAKVLVVPASYDSTGNMFITFTRQFGGAYTSLNYQTFAGIYEWVGNNNTIAAMQFVKDNKALITIPEYWGQAYASVPFVNQQTFVTIGSSAGIRYNIPPVDPSTSLPVFEIGVGPVPYNADMPDNKAVIQQGTNISVMKSGTAQEQLVSWLFLKWLIKVENTVDWAISTGYLPVRSSAYLSTEYQTFLNSPTANQKPISQAANAAFLQSGYMFYDPAFIGSSRARIEVGIAIERILIGDGNITDALQDAFDEANLGG
jgi:multiple sugar transport system substrate-binding protein